MLRARSTGDAAPPTCSMLAAPPYSTGSGVGRCWADGLERPSLPYAAQRATWRAPRICPHVCPPSVPLNLSTAAAAYPVCSRYFVDGGLPAGWLFRASWSAVASRTWNLESGWFGSDMICDADHCLPWRRLRPWLLALRGGLIGLFRRGPSQALNCISWSSSHPPFAEANFGASGMALTVIKPRPIQQSII